MKTSLSVVQRSSCLPAIALATAGRSHAIAFEALPLFGDGGRLEGLMGRMRW